MEKIDGINTFVKMMIIGVFQYFLFIRITNYKENNMKKTLIMSCTSIAIAATYTLLIQYINSMFLMIEVFILNIIYAYVIKINTNYRFHHCLLLTNISFTITYLIYLVAVFISGFILLSVFTVEYNNPFNLFIIFLLMVLIYFVLDHIRRLKNGINFLKNINDINKKSRQINILFLIVIAVLSIPHDSENNILNYISACIETICFFMVFYWIRYHITKNYRKNMKDRTIEVQKLEIEKQKEMIEEIKEENLKLAEVIHKYNNRLSAIELALEEAINKNSNVEFSNELSTVLYETKSISESFAKESEVTKKKLPLTNITGIDNMFKYMQEEARKNNIDFDLKLDNSIHDLIDKIISKDKFEILLGDHLKDAIIAVKSTDKSYRSILVTLGIVDNCYELSIFDTGIEFETDTLIKLGNEKVTTHKEEGGSGIGFMTTFDTLKDVKASLRIEEYDPIKSSYTKSVNFRFDGKCAFEIYSYRAEKISIRNKENKDKKIIIKKI